MNAQGTSYGATATFTTAAGPALTGDVWAHYAGSSTGVRLDSLFSVTDPDAASSGQSVSYYRISLTKDSSLSSDASIVVGSGGTAKTYGFGSGVGNVILTAAEMATAVFLPGTTAAGSSLKLALQAYDSTSTLSDLGGPDDSGSSALLQQTLHTRLAGI